MSRGRAGSGRAAWRKEQAKDPFFQRAKAEGYRARSAYKLLGLDEKFKLLRPGQTVVDLGAAPGSWAQVAARAVGRWGRVVAVDLQPIEPLPGVLTLQADICAPETADRIRALLEHQTGSRRIEVRAQRGPATEVATRRLEPPIAPASRLQPAEAAGLTEISAAPAGTAQRDEAAPPPAAVQTSDTAGQVADALRADTASPAAGALPPGAPSPPPLARTGVADLVLSDAAPTSTGVKLADRLRSVGLAECALMLATRILKPGGAFACKVLRGSDFDAFVAQTKRHFRQVRVNVPPATRQESSEAYVIGLDFRGSGAPAPREAEPTE